MTGRDEIIREMKEMENWMKTAKKLEEKMYDACMESGKANYGAAMFSDGMAVAYSKTINYLEQIIANAERYWEEEKGEAL